MVISRDCVNQKRKYTVLRKPKQNNLNQKFIVYLFSKP